MLLPPTLILGPLAPTLPQKLADGGRLGETWAKTLNAGLMAAALGHLAGKRRLGRGRGAARVGCCLRLAVGSE